MPRSGIAGLDVSSVSCILFSIMGAPICIPSNIFSSIYCWLTFLLMAVLRRCYLIVVLICISLKSSDVESIFQCAFCPSVCLLWRNVHLVLLFIFWLGCVLFFFLFFDIELPELFVYFEGRITGWSHHLQIFSPIQWVVFSFCLWFPLLCKNFLSFIWSHLFVFVLMSATLGGGFKKILLQFMSKSVLPMFFS